MSNSSSERDLDNGASNERRYQESMRKFWSGNIKLTLGLLAIWALAGLGCGVLFADKLNEFKLGGYPLGFWFAQQGSIIVFVFLILAFCIIMNRRDAKHRKDFQSTHPNAKGGSK